MAFNSKKEFIDNHEKFRALLRCSHKLKFNPELAGFFDDHFEKAKRIASKPLNLAVMGEFSAGKSTFINRFLGVNFLPGGISPVTSVITTLKYGEGEKVEVHHKKDDGSVNIVSYKSYSILKNYQKANKIDDELYRRKVNSIKEIVVYLKNNNLKKFNIIDTPGFNHSDICDETTKKIFDRLDFVVWLFNASQLCKLTEEVLLKELFEKVGNIYAIVNKIDIIEKEKIDSLSLELNARINENYPEKFINHSKIHCISVKKAESDFAFLYKSFLENFNGFVINRDCKLSIELIDRICEDIQFDLKKALNNIEYFRKDATLLLTEFFNYRKSEDFLERSHDLSQEVFSVIVTGVNEILDEINTSRICNELPLKNPAMKFYRNFRAFEKFEVIKTLVGNIYEKYFDFYRVKFSILSDEIKNLVKKTSWCCSESLVKKINETLYYNETIIRGFIAKKHKLATDGHILGLLLDDFIYRNFCKERKTVAAAAKKAAVMDVNDIKSIKDVVFTSTENFLGLFKMHNRGWVENDQTVICKGANYHTRKIYNKINQEAVVQIFKMDLDTIEIEESLFEMKDKITMFARDMTNLLHDISQELGKVAKC